MRHEEATDPAVMDTPDERPTGLMQLRFPIGLGVSFVPDETDLAGSVSYNHFRVTQLLAELFRRSGELAKGVKRLNDVAQSMPSRDEYEAMRADVEALQRQVAILFRENTELRQQLPLQRAS